LVTAFSLPTQLQDGAQFVDRSLTLYEAHSQSFEPKDKKNIADAVNKLLNQRKMVEANNQFPDYLSISAICHARRYKRHARQLFDKVDSLSQEARSKLINMEIAALGDIPEETSQEQQAVHRRNPSDGKQTPSPCLEPDIEIVIEEIEMTVLSTTARVLYERENERDWLCSGR